MTMPHLMNCSHSEEWCLDCLKQMYDEHEAEVAELRKENEELRKEAYLSVNQDYLRNMIARDGEEKTNQHIAARLRQIADIVESGEYPQIFSWFDNDDAGLIDVDVRIQLSHPWPG